MALAAFGRGANFVYRLGRHPETCERDAPTGCDEFNGRGFDPHDVIGAQIVLQHQGIERIDHGEQAAAEHGADRVSVPPSEPQLDLDVAPIFGDASHPDPGEQERWPPID
jgi:hypothetical protein